MLLDGLVQQVVGLDAGRNPPPFHFTPKLPFTSV
jgi:hypothetical protein